jgi:ribosomal protein S18 acetylase RimI-like enzyme
VANQTSGSGTGPATMVRGLQIRRATPGDREAVLALWKEAALGDTAPGQWEALLAGEISCVLVGEIDKRIAGTAIASFDGWRAYVYHVAVAPEQRRQGIGHALMEHAEQYLHDAGARFVYVMVDEANTEGLALVGATGYLPEGELVLVKRLP